MGEDNSLSSSYKFKFSDQTLTKQVNREVVMGTVLPQRGHLALIFWVLVSLIWSIHVIELLSRTISGQMVIGAESTRIAEPKPGL